MRQIIFGFCMLMSLSACSDLRSSNEQPCAEKFGSKAVSIWIGRMAENKTAGSLSIEYELDLPYVDAKQIENALAQLPGDSQLVRFNQGGGTHIVVSGAPIQGEAVATSDQNGNSISSPTAFPAVQNFCRSVAAVKGNLTHVAVRTSNYQLDDGKYRLPEVP